MGALTQERLHQVLAYDPVTGIFVWRQSTSNRAPIGSIAGTMQPNGYLRIAIDGVRMYAHRLAWFYVNGEWPLSDVDHIDGVRTNNAIANLRDVSRSVNMQNQRRARSNNHTSGLLGVTWSARRHRWVAQIKVDGLHKGIGYFDDAESAHQAYLAAKRELHAGCSI
ncbi:HNH endonuclease [Burkholderia multivorans]|uniref:HNH endonuclease n=1 Tax=Burkholderia multivorans TaxID=87883 RepID=UPI00201894D7|nr:HNH endonuclease [Burkholderia multivorans]MCO1367173.1 HNH endonuclease [Burkholderia multivorans]MCO1376782.1 HNH endonuclease [Burkholderia multivorans]UQP18728.1 HNH endonuclease [Burkholderia multivorans]UQP86698.1 HNH endonuclease [Burkholderia multivorans]